MLFSLHQFIIFLFFFLWLISSFILLWSEKVLEIISILLNLLRLILWPSMWSILENVLCALEKNVYSAGFQYNVLLISIKSRWSIVSFKTTVYILIFCLDDLSLDVSGLFNSSTIIVLLSFSLGSSLMYWGAPMLGAYIFIIIISSFGLIPWSLCGVRLCQLLLLLFHF